MKTCINFSFNSDKVKERINKCTVYYWAPFLQGWGDEPLVVRKVANILIDSCHSPRQYAGIHVDYNADHIHNNVSRLRGIVTSIKAVIVKKYANEGEYHCSDDPNNEYVLLNIQYADGFEEKNDGVDYGKYSISDVVSYIITLEDVVIGHVECCKYDEDYNNYGRWITFENGTEGDEHLWNNDKLIGTSKGITIYAKRKKKRIVFPEWLQKRISEWQKNFMEQLPKGYEEWSLIDWQDCWVRGWELAKAIRKLLPHDIVLNYGQKKQIDEPILFSPFTNEWETNSGSRRISIDTDMRHKIKEGIYLPSLPLDWYFEKEEELKYRFEVNSSEHHFFPTDKVMLCVDCRPCYYLATILEVQDDGIIVHTQHYLNTSECYSMELII